MSQTDLFTAMAFPRVAMPMARRSDPETSHAAAKSMRQVAAAQHALILSTLKAYGPLGKDGIAHKLNLDGVAVARRMPELLAVGLVKLTGNTVKSHTGRQEREWEAA